MPPAAEAESSFAETARQLIRGADRASLATTLRGDSRPYASLVLLAVDHDASPILLLSDLADHTKNLAADPKASLLVDATQGLVDPLSGARASLLGSIAKSAEPRHRARFLARHPGAASYEEFHDFNVYAMRVERVHLIAGFGRIRWLPGGRVLPPIAPALALREADILQHMNADHADAVQLYASRLLGRPGVGWQMTGIDPEGADLRCEGAVARLPFAHRIEDAEAARAELVRLAKQARSGGGTE